MANVSHHATSFRYRRALYQIRRSISRQVRGMKRQRVVVIAASLFVTGIVVCLLVSRTDPRFPKYRYYAPRPRPIDNHMPWWSWIYCRDDSTRAICGTRQTNFSNFFELPHSQRSLNNEDRDLFFKLFYNVENGTYVEIGAYNGLQESNTRFFDVCLGWNGVLIEANHEIYPSLVRNRPHAHRLHFAPSCPNQPESPTTVSFYSGHHTMSGLTSVLPLETSRTHKVPCGGLTPVLSELLQGHVTLFSLDVEGAEPLVLRHLNWSSSSLFIEAVMVESWSARCPREPEQCASREEVRQLLETQQGYRRYTGPVYKSDLYLHPHSSLVLLDDSESMGRPIQ